MYVVAELGLDDILGGSSGGEFVLFWSGAPSNCCGNIIAGVKRRWAAQLSVTRIWIRAKRLQSVSCWDWAIEIIARDIKDSQAGMIKLWDWAFQIVILKKQRLQQFKT